MTQVKIKAYNREEAKEKFKKHYPDLIPTSIRLIREPMKTYAVRFIKRKRAPRRMRK